MERLLEQSIIDAADPDRVQVQCVNARMRDLSLGIRPLGSLGDPRDTGVVCDGCGRSEWEERTSSAPEKKFLQCGACRMASYCSTACQRSHWKESHKAVCSRLNGEAEGQGERIVDEMKRGDVYSVVILQRNDVAYVMAKKHGLFAAMERLFRREVAGESMERVHHHNIMGISWTQEIISYVFKGNREVIDHFTCACPARMKEYIISSPTAWESLMDAMLYLARALNKAELRSYPQEAALAHRGARCALVTINLGLVHKKVAKALFYQDRVTGKRSQSEARDYALDTMVPKLKTFFRNGGEGFAPDHVDVNRTVQANVFQFTAMLSYWYRALDVDTADPFAFVNAMQFDAMQETMFETVARPMGEGMIELGRTLTMEEMKVRSLRANKEYQTRKRNGRHGGGGKKKGGKKKKNRR